MNTEYKVANTEHKDPDKFSLLFDRQLAGSALIRARLRFRQKRRRDIKRLCLKESNFAKQSVGLIMGEAIFKGGSLARPCVTKDLHSSMSFASYPSPFSLLAAQGTKQIWEI